MTIQPDVQAPALNRRKVGDYVVKIGRAHV